MRVKQEVVLQEKLKKDFENMIKNLKMSQMH